MSEGVESALHSCLMLAWLGDEGAVATVHLAGAFDLSPTYLNKQLQALSKAGIVASTPGANGGFRLARAPAQITLWDIVAAIEGSENAFRCLEIRKRGAMARVPKAEFAQRCLIARAMDSAEAAWRQALAAQTLADIQASFVRDAPLACARMRQWYDSRNAGSAGASPVRS